MLTESTSDDPLLFSGIASIAAFNPLRAGPIWNHCSSRTLPGGTPASAIVNRQIDDGLSGSPTHHSKHLGGSHAVITHSVCHPPIAAC